MNKVVVAGIAVGLLIIGMIIAPTNAYATETERRVAVNLDGKATVFSITAFNFAQTAFIHVDEKLFNGIVDRFGTTSFVFRSQTPMHVSGDSYVKIEPRIQVGKKLEVEFVVSTATGPISKSIPLAGDIDSPRKQMEKGVAPVDVECRSLRSGFNYDGLYLMNIPSGRAACVKGPHVAKMEERGWEFVLNHDNGSINSYSWQQPQNRLWAFKNMDNVFAYPHEISRGSGPLHEFGSNPVDLSDVTLEYQGKQMKLKEFLKASHTDALLVLRGNDIVYESYLRMEPSDRHSIQSISKTTVSALIGKYVEDGTIDLTKKAREYIPDIGSGYGEATVQQVMDMDVSNNFSFDFTDPNAHIYEYEVAAGWRPDDANKSPGGKKQFIREEINSDDIAGIGVSQYQDPNTDLAAWILEVVTGKQFYELFEEDVYQHLGAERDAVMSLDVQGFSFGAGGWVMTLRDLARYGQLYINEGIAPDGTQVIPKSWIEELRTVTKGVSYKGVDGYYYHNQMTTNGEVLAHSGWAGQFLYADPENKIVVVKFSALTELTGGNLGQKIAMYRLSEAISDHLAE